MLTSKQKRDRIEKIAQQRLALHPTAYMKFTLHIASMSMSVSEASLLCDGIDPNLTVLEAIDPAYALREFDRRAIALVDRWASENIKLPEPCVVPILPMHTGIIQASIPTNNETAVQRQKRRYEACIKAGLAIDTQNTYTHLPRGVGKLAKAEGISTAAFTKDVKLHIERTTHS